MDVGQKGDGQVGGIVARHVQNEEARALSTLISSQGANMHWKNNIIIVAIIYFLLNKLTS